MPLHVEQFRYGRDNLGYLVFGRSEAMAVDGGGLARNPGICGHPGTEAALRNPHPRTP